MKFLETVNSINGAIWYANKYDYSYNCAKIAGNLFLHLKRGCYKFHYDVNTRKVLSREYIAY